MLAQVDVLRLFYPGTCLDTPYPYPWYLLIFEDASRL